MKAVARRASWGFFDQVLSSATNFALGLFVAATVTPSEFGAFSVVYGAYGICLGISAGFASQPLVVRFSAQTENSLRDAERASTGTALGIGMSGGALCLLTSLLLPSELGAPLRVLAFVLPGLLLQDAWRYAFMAARTPRAAALNDALWAVLQLVGIALVALLWTISATSMVLAWGAAATIAAVIACGQGGALPALGATRSWLRDTRDLGPRYALESLAHRSGVWLALALIGVFAGLQSVAALRGGLLLVVGPLNLLFVGAAFVAVPESVRLFERDPHRLPRLTWLVSGGVTALSATWCTAVLLSGSLLGERVLGETWPLARPLLILLALFAVAQALAIGPAQGLWAIGAAGRSLASQLTNVVMLVATTSTGAVLGGARGAAVGLVVTGVLSLAVWSWQFSRGFRGTVRARADRTGSAAEPSDSDPDPSALHAV